MYLVKLACNVKIQSSVKCNLLTCTSIMCIAFQCSVVVFSAQTQCHNADHNADVLFVLLTSALSVCQTHTATYIIFRGCGV